MKNIVTINTAIQMLNKGGVGVMPTDTVYGLVARAHDPQAVARLYALKQREHKPGSIIAANTGQLIKLGVPETYINKVKKWWPGSLSAILPVDLDFTYLHQGIGDIAIRVIEPRWLCTALEQTGPLLTSSANQPGKPSSINVNEAWNYFHDEVDFYVDGGDLSSTRTSSTIVKVKDDDTVEIIRQGVVKL